MKIYISLYNNQFVTGWSRIRNTDEEIEIEVNDKHEVLKNPFIYKYVDGELIKDEVKQQELIDEMNKPTEQERIEALENALLDLILGGGTND